MKLTKMTLTVAAVMALGMSAMAGPILSLKPAGWATATIQESKPLKVELAGAGLLQIAPQGIASGMRVRVIDPKGRALLVDEIDARRKLEVRITQAGRYTLVLARSAASGASGASSQDAITAQRKGRLNKVKPSLRVHLAFQATLADKASSADAEPHNGGGDLGGKPYRQSGKQIPTHPQP